MYSLLITLFCVYPLLTTLPCVPTLDHTALCPLLTTLLCVPTLDHTALCAHSRPHCSVCAHSRSHCSVYPLLITLFCVCPLLTTMPCVCPLLTAPCSSQKNSILPQVFGSPTATLSPSLLILSLHYFSPIFSQRQPYCLTFPPPSLPGFTAFCRPEHASRLLVWPLNHVCLA